MDMRGVAKTSELPNGNKFGNYPLLRGELCPPFACRSPNPRDLRMGPYSQTGPFRRWLSGNGVVKAGPSQIRLVFLQEKETRTPRKTPGM